MADKISLDIVMHDGVSSPAENAADSLENLAHQGNAAKRILGGVNLNGMKGGFDSLTDVTDGVLKLASVGTSGGLVELLEGFSLLSGVAGDASEASEGLAEGAEGASAAGMRMSASMASVVAIAAPAALALAAVAAAAVLVAGAAYGVGRASVAMLQAMAPIQKQERLFSLAYGKQGIATLNAMTAAMTGMGISLDEARSASDKLAASFTNPAAAKQASEMIATLHRLGAETGAATDFVAELGRQQFVDTTAIDRLNAAVPGLNANWERIGAAMGTTGKRAEEMAASGELSASRFGAAVDTLTRGAAAGLGPTIEDSTNRARTSLQRMWETMARGGTEGGGLGNMLEGLAGKLEQIANDPGVQNTLSVVGSTIGWVAGQVMTFATSALPGFMAGWNAVKPALDPVITAMGPLMSRLGGTSGIMTSLGTVVGTVAGAIAGGIATIIGTFVNLAMIGGIVGSALYNAFSVVDGYVQQFIGAGANLVMGLVQGIQSMASAPVDAVRNIASNAISGAKGILGIASPSKVFTVIGEQTTDGMVMGLERGNESVETAAGAVADSAVSAATGTVNNNPVTNISTTPPVAPPVGAPNIAVTVNVDAGGTGATAVDIATQVAQAVEAQVRALMSSAALSTGLPA